MVDRGTCPICQKSGFVRYETVVTGGRSQRLGSCGACDNSWPVSDDGRPMKTVSIRQEVLNRSRTDR